METHEKVERQVVLDAAEMQVEFCTDPEKALACAQLWKKSVGSFPRYLTYPVVTSTMPSLCHL